MHGDEKTCPELQECSEEKTYWKENENVRANVGPVRIMMAPWLISTRPGHANKTVREHHPVVFMKISDLGSASDSFYFRQVIISVKFFKESVYIT